MPLACREDFAPLADLRFVPVRQAQNHLVHASGHGGGDDRLGVRILLEAGDVGGDGAGEQFHVLGQVADVPAERLAPLVDRGPVEAHGSRHGRPDTDERAQEGRLSRGAGADDAEPLPRPQGKGHVAHARPALPRRGDRQLLDDQAGDGRRQVEPGRWWRQGRENPGQPAPAVARRHEGLPLPDGKLDRCERPRGGDGGGDDGPCRHLAADGQPCSECQDERLQQDPEGARGGTEPSDDVARPPLLGEKGRIETQPALRHPLTEAHRAQHLGVTAPGKAEADALCVLRGQRALGAT